MVYLAIAVAICAWMIVSALSHIESVLRQILEQLKEINASTLDTERTVSELKNPIQFASNVYLERSRL